MKEILEVQAGIEPAQLRATIGTSEFLSVAGGQLVHRGTTSHVAVRILPGPHFVVMFERPYLQDAWPRPVKGHTEMVSHAIKAIANAILYEGYMLYPYRPSALKNRSPGWTFGTLVPQAYAAVQPGEASCFQAEIIVSGDAVHLSAEIRFLQLAGDRSEALDRSVCLSSLSITDLLTHPTTVTFSFPGDGEERSQACCQLEGMVRVSAQQLSQTAARIVLALQNLSPPTVPWKSRDQVLQQALVSAHAVLGVTGGEFVSLLDPPAQFRAAAESCKQLGVFPVLAGEERERTAMLVSPIFLYDYPQIASNSKGDFFDASEIDELLT
ncbi:MAG TPA: hypothetical protein VFM10_03795, partial [Terriglobales bacterium]|nr:hypothetical protein [Terriglobales bacterium]